MKIELIHRPGNTAARITMQPGEGCTAESGAMIAMSGAMGITTTTHKKKSGSFFKAAKRFAAGESIFLNHYDPGTSPGELWLGANLAGDMTSILLEDETLIVQGGGFLACESAVDIDMGWQGFKSLLSGERAFWVRLQGPGQIILSSFGAIYPIRVNGEHLVDSGHIVAFEESLDFSITKAGKSWLHSFIGGEGFVCKFKGKGTVWCQSHSPKSFGKVLSPKLRRRA